MTTLTAEQTAALYRAANRRELGEYVGELLGEADRLAKKWYGEKAVAERKLAEAQRRLAAVGVIPWHEDEAGAHVVYRWELLAALTPEADERWTPFDRADHEAGHPSGHDCLGDAITGKETCPSFRAALTPDADA